MPKKYLLLSDIPPCGNYTGGVVLADQCRQLKPGSVCAFVVLNPVLSPQYYEDLAWLPIKTVEKPNELWKSIEGTSEAISRETINATSGVDALVAQAVKFGLEQGVDAVWAMLEGQTVVRMAAPLAQALGVPLYTQVWDPLSWWLDAHGVDEVNGRQALRMFDLALQNSQGVATASWSMADLYRRRFKVRALPVINSQDAAVACKPVPKLRHDDRLSIGMVGQFYAADAWGSLVASLNDSGWRVGNRSVEIYYLGQEPPLDVPPDRLVHGGWKTQPDAIAALAEHADLFYCPYPFSRSMEEVARFSFPSKLVMYAAAGRPIFCHAPWYSGPARYIADRRAGVVCGDLNARAAMSMLSWLVGDTDHYADMCRFAREAFLKDFTRERMGADFLHIVSAEHGPLKATPSA